MIGYSRVSRKPRKEVRELLQVGNILRCKHDGTRVLVLGEPTWDAQGSRNARDGAWVTPMLLLWDRGPKTEKIKWWVYETHLSNLKVIARAGDLP